MLLNVRVPFGDLVLQYQAPVCRVVGTSPAGTEVGGRDRLERKRYDETSQMLDLCRLSPVTRTTATNEGIGKKNNNTYTIFVFTNLALATSFFPPARKKAKLDGSAAAQPEVTQVVAVAVL